MSRRLCVAVVVVASVSLLASSGGCVSFGDCVDPDPTIWRDSTCDGDVLVETAYHGGNHGARCEATTTRTTCAGPALTCIAYGLRQEEGVMPAKCERACVTDDDCDGLSCSKEGSGGRRGCAPTR